MLRTVAYAYVGVDGDCADSMNGQRHSPGFLVTFPALVVATALMAACATGGTGIQPDKDKLTPAPATESASNTSWWQVCFRMPFADNGQPRWAMDHLLAHRVVAPALETFESDISLWRFHRRAADDAAGHRLSVIIYSDAQTADEFMAALSESKITGKLLDSDYVDAVVPRCGDDEKESSIAATSDSNWDPRIQRSWPYFIMGVSAHWLALIDEVAAGVPASSGAPADLLARYGTIQDKMVALWEGHGQHAYLHHLNAIFGYQPLLLRKQMRF